MNMAVKLHPQFGQRTSADQYHIVKNSGRDKARGNDHRVGWTTTESFYVGSRGFPTSTQLSDRLRQAASSPIVTVAYRLLSTSKQIVNLLSFPSFCQQVPKRQYTRS